MTHLDDLMLELSQLRADLKEANETESETIKELIRLREDSIQNLLK